MHLTLCLPDRSLVTPFIAVLQIVRAARRGYAPDNISQLTSRIRKLYDLEDQHEGLDVTRMLAYNRSALARSHHNITGSFAALSKLLPNAEVCGKLK